MGRKPLLSEETVDLIWKLHMEGKNGIEISKMLGISANTIYKKLKIT